jgi:hypothetical protein
MEFPHYFESVKGQTCKIALWSSMMRAAGHNWFDATDNWFLCLFEGIDRCASSNANDAIPRVSVLISTT